MSSGILVAILSGSLAAQGLGQLKDIAGGSGLGDAASSLGSLSSITSGSTGNVAGIIEYCMKNNYLNADNASSVGNASSVRNQLMGRMTAGGDQAAESNPDYISGAKGIVTGSGGQSVDLSMAGLKDKAVKKVCEKILDQGKSLL
jgi:hypothetical protein